MLFHLKENNKIEEVGEKAKNIHWMIQSGMDVPVTYILPFRAHAEYLRDPKGFQESLGLLLSEQLDLNKPYAVRSSANLEDSFQHSFAGQFTSFLDVKGLDNLLQAVQELYSYPESPSIRAYLEKTSLDPQALKMSVVIQEMVEPRISGVSFSKNPLTGLDETIIEAVLGSGESYLQGGETPYRWVNKWGKWTDEPADSPIDLGIIQEVADRTNHAAKIFASPVDLEWVFDGDRLYFVQVRPITQLDKINIYSNRISREVFPGLIKPLVWSVNVPLVNSAWIRLLTELIGANTLQPDELAKAFAYRAYFNMGVLGRIFTMLGMPKETLELLMGLEGGEQKPHFRPSLKTLRFLPRMLYFLLRVMRYDRRLKTELESIRHEYEQFDTGNITGLEPYSILNSIDHLYRINQRTAYQNIVVPLLMGVFNAMLKRQLAGIGVDITRFDTTHGLEELQEYNPNIHISHLARQFNSLDGKTRSAIRERPFQELEFDPAAGAFRADVISFLDRFGHLSESGNDFSSVPWRENPDLVLNMVITEADRLVGISADPPAAANTKPGHFESHPDPDDLKVGAVTWDDLQINVLQKLKMTPIYNRSRKFQYFREAVSSLYTYGYGLFRVYFLELGGRLAGEGSLDQAEDIFYLSWDEIRSIFSGEIKDRPEGKNPSLRQLVADRKQDMEQKSGLTLPEIIYGDDLPPYEESHKDLDILKGIPTSRGYYQGAARVVSSMDEHYKLNDGDILIIPYSDVSWTPLFARAGAVVAESGGILSHSSIVARELNLPCVVSVPGACQIPDNSLVSVNGYNGEIHIHKDG